jgi:uncharacterized membrane protein
MDITMPTVTAVGRIHSAIVVSRQLQDDAQERIVSCKSQEDLQEAKEDLERARQTEVNLRGQLEQALQLEANFRRAFLQGAEGTV